MPHFLKRTTVDGNVWDCRFRSTVNGKDVYKRLSGYKRKSDAEKAYREYLASTTITYKGALTFDDAYFNFFAFKKNRIKESSYLSLKSFCDSIILPNFTNKYVDEISKQHIITFQNSIDQKFSYNYKCKIRQTLGSIFDYSIKYLDTKNNPIKLTDGFVNLAGKEEMKFWTRDEYTTFIDHVEKFPMRCLFELLYFTGCRKGEAMALNWSDVDFKTRTLKINKSYTRKTTQGTFAITTPKTRSSNRIIALPKQVLDSLSILKEETEGNYIFNGHIPITEKVVVNAFHKAIKQSKLPPIRIHDLRHSHVTYLIHKGVSIVAIAKRLGHSDIEQTLNTYAHLYKEDEMKIIEILEEN